LVGANGKAPVDGDLYGISVKVTDVDKITDDYLYLKWYDIKSVNNQAGYIIQRTANKTVNIKAANDKINISTPVALKGDRIYATFSETDTVMLKEWLIKADNLRIDRNFASFTVDNTDISVDAIETVKKVSQTEDKKEENKENSVPEKEDNNNKKPDQEIPDKNNKPTVNNQNKNPIKNAGSENDNTLVVIIIVSAVVVGVVILSAATLFFLMLLKKKRTQMSEN
jgi:hypothetical protein